MKGTQQDLEKLAKVGDLTDEEAEKLFQSMVDEGLLCWDDKDRALWRWV